MKNKSLSSPASVPNARHHTAPLYDWLRERSAGVLLHPTSLPGAQGVGVLDAQAVHFLDFLQAAGVQHWQVCPLGPTGYGDSPYQCFSAFAGNPYLIDLAPLVTSGLLREAELQPLRNLPPHQTDYGALYLLKWPLLARAHSRWAKLGKPALPYGDFAAFRARHADWLDAYCLFRALKDHFNGRLWLEWPEEVRDAHRAPGHPLARRLAAEREAHAFAQYLFFGQWAQLRAAAAKRGVQLIGDLPIFAALDSADAWARPELFELGPDLQPLAVAGVPPDYFSADGQLWGNPLYRWEAHAADGYKWWIARLRAAFDLADVVRIDHFRGFDTYWRIPVPAENARAGRWENGPGLELFRAFHHALPGARIIAEDLGELTDSVHALLRATGLPGMSVLQFAFGSDAANSYLPHNHTANSIVYTGTHDNDTTAGWYRGTDERTRDYVRRYLRVSGDDVAWDFVRSAYKSTARLAIVPLQDLLSLGSSARFNKPGSAQGNWQWRVTNDQLQQLTQTAAPALRELAQLYGR